MDDDAREMYDQYGHDGPGESFSPDDIFNQFFAGGPFAYGGTRRKRRGDDSKIPYEVTLEDLYLGKSVKLQVEKNIVCTGCQGFVKKNSSS